MTRYSMNIILHTVAYSWAEVPFEVILSQPGIWYVHKVQEFYWEFC